MHQLEGEQTKTMCRIEITWPLHKVLWDCHIIPMPINVRSHAAFKNTGAAFSTTEKRLKDRRTGTRSKSTFSVAQNCVHVMISACYQHIQGSQCRDQHQISPLLREDLFPEGHEDNTKLVDTQVFKKINQRGNFTGTEFKFWFELRNQSNASD
jgi:hypothetical protein